MGKTLFLFACVVVVASASGSITLPAQSYANYEVRALAFSPDGKYLASGGSRQAVVLRSTANGTELWQRSSQDKGSVQGIAFSLDGRLVAFGDNYARIEIRDVKSGELTREFGHEKHFVNALLFLPDGDVLSGGTDHTARLWRDGSEIRKIEIPGPRRLFRLRYCCGSPVASLALSSTGRTVALACEDGYVYLWSVGTGELRPANETRSAGPFFPAILLDGEQQWKLLTEIDDRVSTLTQGNAPSIYTGLKGGAISFAISADGAWIGAGNATGTVAVWEAATMKLLGTIENTGAVTALRFSPDGSHLAIGLPNRDVQLWDRTSLKRKW